MNLVAKQRWKIAMVEQASWKDEKVIARSPLKDKKMSEQQLAIACVMIEEGKEWDAYHHIIEQVRNLSRITDEDGNTYPSFEALIEKVKEN